MSDETLPIIHTGPWTEGYRREVMAKHGTDPGIEAGLPPLQPLVWRPTREQVRAYKGDFAYTPKDGQNSAWQSYAYAGWPYGEPYTWAATMRYLSPSEVEIVGAVRAPTPSEWRALRGLCRAAGIARVQFLRHAADGRWVCHRIDI